MTSLRFGSVFAPYVRLNRETDLIILGSKSLARISPSRYPSKIGHMDVGKWRGESKHWRKKVRPSFSSVSRAKVAECSTQ